MTTKGKRSPQWETMQKARLCLGDWEQALGKEFVGIRPQLVKCIGEITKSFPHPDTGLRLAVRECACGYVAHPVGDFEHDAEDLTLTEKDVQLWRLGSDGKQQLPVGRGGKIEHGGDISNLELKKHFDGRFDTLGRNYADLQSENQALKQDLAQVLSNISRQVEPKFFQWIFVILGAGSVNAAAKILKIPGSTFADQLKEYVAKGGLYRVLYSMLGVRKKGAGRKRIERFNELFKEHQGEKTVAEPNVLRELLDGLEALNGANWKGMREELITIVKAELPEA